MTVIHTHPEYPEQAAYVDALHALYRALVRKLSQNAA